MQPESQAKRRTPQPGPRGGARGGPITQFAALARQEDGAVAVMAALAIPVLLGVTGLALEYGQLLFVRAEAQRTADLASHAAAAAYVRTGSPEAMVAAARGVARLNGFGDHEIAVFLDPAFPTASGTAVRATITTPKPLYLPRLVGGDTSVDVVASAVAGAVGSGEPTCIQAINPGGTGITLSGSATMRTDACAVASNARVAAPCGTGILTNALSYNAGGDPLIQGCTTIRTVDGEATRITTGPTVDPLAGSEPVMLAAAEMAATAALAPPSDIIVPPGPDIDFAWNQNATIAQAAAIGCTASFANATWRFSCPGLSTVSLGNITIGGGVSLIFNEGAGPGVTYNISGSIRNTGTRMTFAGGTYNVAQGIVTGGGSVTEFGAGTYRIGRATHSCDGARYSICNVSQLSFAGPGTFVLPGGLRNSGGAVTTLGTGNGNSFRFGPGSGGSAISVGGGAQIYMGDANGGLFEVSGRIDGGGGGSCLILPAAALHQINGSIRASGAIRFGAGLYAINGHMHLGSDGGGSADCRGDIISVEAINTTFLISGAGTVPGSGACAGQVFCVSAGYSNIRITAPQSGPFTDLAVIGPLDPARTAGASFTGGASGSQVTGAFYIPHGTITLSGGASASGSGAGCFQLIGASITMSGGTSLASECRLPGGSGGGSDRVVILG